MVVGNDNDNDFMKIILATQNRHKVEEVRAYFESLRGLKDRSHLHRIQWEIATPPWADRNDIETGRTLRENALQKARGVAQRAVEWALADDTGLFVDALGGRPGIFSARYAGENATFPQNIRKLLAEMKDVPEKDRSAHFSSVLALVHPDGREVTVEGRLEGVIAAEPKGKGGFGYDPVFFLPNRRCTLAEISIEEKNRISHRAKALFKMRGVLESPLHHFH